MPKITDNQSVPKVDPQTGQEPDVEESGAEPGQEDGRESGGWFSGVRNGVSKAAQTVTTSWFGLKPLGNAVSNGVGKIAGSLGLSKTVTSIGLAVVLAAGGGAAGIAMVNNTANEIIIRQEEYVDDCADDYDAALNAKAATQAVGDVSAQQLEYAEQLWAWGKALGMSDYACAGMIGNMQHESGGLDPYAVEGIYDEYGSIDGPRKSALFNSDHSVNTSAMNSHVTGYLASHTSGINLPAYQATEAGQDRNYYCGIGMIQWTGPTAYKLLEDAADMNVDWTDFDYQLAHLIKSESSRLEGFLADSTSDQSVRDATASWGGYMESGSGHPNYSINGFDSRLQYANEWYSRLSSRSNEICAKWSDFVDSVMAMAQTTVTGANTKHAADVAEECLVDEDTNMYDNSTIAAAGVAYSWETKDKGKPNNGTELYVYLQDTMAGRTGEVYYRSCDRGTATAIHWANADDNFPWGATDEQDVYCQTHPDLWENVGTLDAVGEDGLEPGDVLLTTASRRGSSCGHIVLYVGNEEVQKKFPSSNAKTVSASLNDRSPGCGDSTVLGSYGGQGYYVYRYIGNYEGTDGNLCVDADRYDDGR